MKKRREMSMSSAEEEILMIKGRPKKVIILDHEDVPVRTDIVAAAPFSISSSPSQDKRSSINPLNCISEDPVIYSPTPLNFRLPQGAERSIPFRNTLNVNKFVSELLAQNGGLGLPCNDPLSSEVLVENKFVLVPQRTNEILSINMKARDDSFVVIDGYKVKRELAPVLKSIFSKYGDIAAKSSFPAETRSCFLEIACGVYKKLEGLDFMDLTSVKIQSMVKQVRDLELVNVDVGWLLDRLEEISNAKRLYEGGVLMEQAKKRSLELIEEKKKRVEKSEKLLEACLATLNEVLARQNQERKELAVAMAENGKINEKILDAREGFKKFKGSSLVDGLI